MRSRRWDPGTPHRQLSSWAARVRKLGGLVYTSGYPFLPTPPSSRTLRQVSASEIRTPFSVRECLFLPLSRGLLRICQQVAAGTRLVSPPTSSGAVTSALWCTVSRNIKPRSHSGGGTSLSRVTAWGSGVRAAHGRGRGQVGFTVSELTVHAQPASWVLGC